MIATEPSGFPENAARERRDQIVAAAYDLLDEAGLEGLTIRAVLTRTGLARRAFYECFAGKDDLVLAVFERTIFLAAAHYRSQVAPVPDAMERLGLIVNSIAMGRATFDDGKTMPSNRRGAAMSREHLRLAESRPAELEAALRPLIELLTEQLALAATAGSVRNDPPDRLAKLVYNLVSTTVHAELIAEEAGVPDTEHRTRLAAEIWNFCRRAIAA